MTKHRRGRPLLARAVFGRNGTESIALPVYESQRWSVTDRIDTSTDHYVGDRYSHTSTDSRFETRTENRAVRTGTEHVHFDTIDVVFEYPENETMRMRSPMWARQGDLVYVMCHRGVGRPVYDLYCPAKDRWADLQTDHRPPVGLVLPLLVGIVMFGVHAIRPDGPGPDTWPQMIAAAGIALLAMLTVRLWRIWQLRSSRIRGNDEMIRLIERDREDRDEIQDRIRLRI